MIITFEPSIIRISFFHRILLLNSALKKIIHNTKYDIKIFFLIIEKKFFCQLSYYIFFNFFLFYRAPLRNQNFFFEIIRRLTFIFCHKIWSKQQKVFLIFPKIHLFRITFFRKVMQTNIHYKNIIEIYSAHFSI